MSQKTAPIPIRRLAVIAAALLVPAVPGASAWIEPTPAETSSPLGEAAVVPAIPAEDLVTPTAVPFVVLAGEPGGAEDNVTFHRIVIANGTSGRLEVRLDEAGAPTWTVMPAGGEPGEFQPVRVSVVKAGEASASGDSDGPVPAPAAVTYRVFRASEGAEEEYQHTVHFYRIASTDGEAGGWQAVQGPLPSILELTPAQEPAETSAA